MAQFSRFGGKSGAGFTLIEFLIAFAIFVIIGGSVVIFLRDFFTLGAALESSLLIEREAEELIRNMVREIREAAPSSIGSYPIEKADEDSFAFYANIDEDPLKERIHYFLDGTDFKKSIVEPAGQPLTYSTTTAQESLKTVLRDVKAGSSSPIFLYRGTFSTSTPSQLFIQDIRLVIIRLTADRDPNALPAAISVSTVVTIRNLKTY